MRISARLLFALVILVIFAIPKNSAFAQTYQQEANTNVQTASTNSTINNFLTPNVDASVPENHHEYTQAVLIDVLSAFMCQLTGIDPTDPKQPCLGVNPVTGKIGVPPTNNPQFGQAANTQPRLGGALGIMTNFIAVLYVPAVSSTQYVGYLASNFGITHPAYAANGPGGGNCEKSPFGYGFCGLVPIFTLWVDVRDFAYAFLTILFIVIGIGVMLRFRVDPRTVMTLQNQIPRVIIAILLITFSYAIAGIMVDLMWTATYAGIAFITSAANTQVAITCNGHKLVKSISLSQSADQNLLQDPFEFTNIIFVRDCTGDVQSGVLGVADGVSNAFGDLIVQIIANLLGININGGCSLIPFNIQGCIANFFIWLTEQLVRLIVIIAILVALFRLWFKLLGNYVTFLIFVVMGPLWIVFGLIPGRPLGFEKWLRIIFANLAGFPLAAFLIAFARVLVDTAAKGTTGGTGGFTNSSADPQHVFIPPLVGNPNVHTFVYFIALGALLIAPNVPDQIKERMKATGQGKYGAAVGAAITGAAGAATAPGRKAWSTLNRRDQFGRPEGSLALLRDQAAEHIPLVGRNSKYGQWRRARRAKARSYYDGDGTGGDKKKEEKGG